MASEKLLRRREEIAARFDLPAEAAGCFKLTLVGTGRALVENHRGLGEYTRERVDVRAPAGTVRIEGEALELGFMDGEALLVTGRILALTLL